MAGSDRSPTASALERARRIALDIETRTSLIPLPPALGAEDERLAHYDALVTDAELRGVTRDLFKDGYYSRAVEEAFKLVNNKVKERCGTVPGKPRDGADLMHRAFDQGAPLLRFNRLQSLSQKDEQVGYRFLFAGAMTGIRNPRAHEHRIIDDPQSALEMLVMANHFLRKLERAIRTRVRRPK